MGSSQELPGLGELGVAPCPTAQNWTPVEELLPGLDALMLKEFENSAGDLSLKATVIPEINGLAIRLALDPSYPSQARSYRMRLVTAGPIFSGYATSLAVLSLDLGDQQVGVGCIPRVLSVRSRDGAIRRSLRKALAQAFGAALRRILLSQIAGALEEHAYKDFMTHRWLEITRETGGKLCYKLSVTSGTYTIPGLEDKHYQFSYSLRHSGVPTFTKLRDFVNRVESACQNLTRAQQWAGELLPWVQERCQFLHKLHLDDIPATIRTTHSEEHTARVTLRVTSPKQYSINMDSLSVDQAEQVLGALKSFEKGTTLTAETTLPRLETNLQLV